MVTKENELTKREQNWINEFKKILRKKPKEIELILDDAGIYIWTSGSFSKHMNSKHNGFGMDSNPDIEHLRLGFIQTKNIIPYSEGQ